MKDGIIIQARVGSTRLPGKILLPFYDGKRIIDILIESIRTTYPDKTIVLATSNNSQDDILAKIAAKADIECYRGDENDVLSRFIGAAETFGLERLIRVCSDNPFLQTVSFLNMFTESDETHADYIAYGFADGKPTIQSHLGFFSELATANALYKVSCATNERIYHEHVTNYLYTHPDDFSIKLIPLPYFLENRHDLRFTLDTQEDFNLLRKLYVNYKEKTDGSLQSLINLVDSNPIYHNQMLRNIEKNEK